MTKRIRKNENEKHAKKKRIENKNGMMIREQGKWPKEKVLKKQEGFKKSATLDILYLLKYSQQIITLHFIIIFLDEKSFCHR